MSAVVSDRDKEAEREVDRGFIDTRQSPLLCHPAQFL
jgi:hypothetical protein